MFVYGGIEDETLDGADYDIMISVICLVVIIVLVCLIFGYWCCYYPKQQTKRNDEFWLGQVTGSIMDSAVSHNEEYHE